MYTDRAGQCAAMPGGSGSLESTGTVFKLQCTDPEQPAGKMPPAPKGTVKYELAGTGFSLQQKAEKQPIVSGKISSEIPSERYFSACGRLKPNTELEDVCRSDPVRKVRGRKSSVVKGGWRKELSVSAARWGFEGAGYIHIPVQKDSARGRFAGQFERAQPAATNASRLIAQGVDVRTVAGLLGHAQPSTTLDIYSHAFDKNKKLAQEKLAEAMGL